MKYIILACTTLLLVGCDFETYRYPCQDPSNWNSEECQKPLCEVSQTCPEHIFKNQDEVVKAATKETEVAKTVNSKGGCK